MTTPELTPAPSRFLGLRRRLTDRSARQRLCPSPRQNIASCVVVPVENQSAILATMDAYRERLSLGRFASAAGAYLRRSATVHDTDSPSSFFRFEGKDVEKLRPSGIVHALGENRAGKATDVQIFNGYVIVPAHQVERRLEVEVSPGVLNPSMMAGQRADHLPTTIPAPRSLRDASFRPLQSDYRPDEWARVGDMLAVAGSQEGFQPEVYACFHSAIWQEAVPLSFAGERHEPVAAPVPAQGDGFDGPFDWAGQVQLAASYPVQPQAPTIQTPSRLAVGHAIEPLSALETRVARSLPRLHATKESLKRQVEALQVHLHHLSVYRSVGRAFLLQAGHALPLTEVSDPDSRVFPRLPAFLQRVVVNGAQGVELLLRVGRSGWGELCLVTEGLTHAN